MSLIDWAIMAIVIIAVRFVSLSTRGYMRGVADFLSANRSAGRYLLTIASAMGGAGVISFVASFEMLYSAGVSPCWWTYISIMVWPILFLTGWIFYRFRETRALTLAQFLEMRYTRKFRIFAGCLCWISGMLNFGIFPAVAARFFMYFCGLPDFYHIPYIPIAMPTFATIMALDLIFALMFVNMGGQVSVMVTECVQGIFCGFAFLIVAATVLIKLQWPDIVRALNMAPENASMIHPFQTSAVKDFNVWFFLIGIFGAFYGYMSWQGTSGFNSSARSPHEQKMGQIIGIWRSMPQFLMITLLGLAAFAIMHLPEFANKAAAVTSTLKTIGNEEVQNQMRVPIAMAHFLPVGVKGILATIMLCISFTCHDTYMHSWGSIFIQDVYMPIRNKTLTPDEHIRLLRWSIIGVAIFAFIFSLVYPQTMMILMYMAITGTIWLGGSGAVIIGGLYWKKGTTAAAYSSLIYGSVVGIFGLVAPVLYKNHYHKDFPVNSQWLYLFGMLGAMVIYIIVSLLTGGKEKEFNLERMLHRGKYADAQQIEEAAPRNKLMELIGITKEFSLGDRILAIAMVIWNFGWFTFFVVVTIVNLLFKVPVEWWAKFWHTYILLQLSIGIPTTLWFTVGGLMDIKSLLNALAIAVRDHTDDGRVVHEKDLLGTSPDTSVPSTEMDFKIGVDRD